MAARKNATPPAPVVLPAAPDFATQAFSAYDEALKFNVYTQQRLNLIAEAQLLATFALLEKLEGPKPDAPAAHAAQLPDGAPAAEPATSTDAVA